MHWKIFVFVNYLLATTDCIKINHDDSKFELSVSYQNIEINHQKPVAVYLKKPPVQIPKVHTPGNGVSSLKFQNQLKVSPGYAVHEKQNEGPFPISSDLANYQKKPNHQLVYYKTPIGQSQRLLNNFNAGIVLGQYRAVESKKHNGLGQTYVVPSKSRKFT